MNFFPSMVSILPGYIRIQELFEMNEEILLGFQFTKISLYMRLVNIQEGIELLSSSGKVLGGILS